MGKPRARIAADTPHPDLAATLRTLADAYDAGLRNRDLARMNPAQLLDLVRTVADVMDMGQPHGPLRALRRQLFAVAVRRDVKRRELAEAAAVSMPAVGAELTAAYAAARGDGTDPVTEPEPVRERRPRPA